jgi:hypothetical protein
MIEKVNAVASPAAYETATIQEMLHSTYHNTLLVHSEPGPALTISARTQCTTAPASRTRPSPPSASRCATRGSSSST